MWNTNNGCYLCGRNDFRIIHYGTRDNPNLNVLMCTNCGLVSLSSFDHITDDFYSDSGMHTETMEEWIKSTEVDDKRRSMYVQDKLGLMFDRTKRNVVDIGAGNCNLARKLSCIDSINIYAVEPEVRVSNYVKSSKSYDKVNLVPWLHDLPTGMFDMATMFHVIEHLSDPIEFLKLVRSKMKDCGTLVIETPNADDALITLYDCQAFQDFTYWGCHLFVFDPETLSDVAEQAGFRVVGINQIQRYPLSNHLYWLSKGKPGGHRFWSHVYSPELNRAYTESLKWMEKCDTLLAVLRND